jgi:hypothetical protein
MLLPNEVAVGGDQNCTYRHKPKQITGANSATFRCAMPQRGHLDHNLCRPNEHPQAHRRPAKYSLFTPDRTILASGELFGPGDASHTVTYSCRPSSFELSKPEFVSDNVG